MEQTSVNTRAANTQDDEIDLLELAGVLWNKILFILIGFAVGAILAFGITKFMITPLYKAQSTIYVLTKSTSITSMADINIGSSLTVDFKYIGTTRDVIEAAIQELGLNTTYESLVKSITITNPSNSRLLEITVTDPDPVAAANISNAVADSLRERIADVMDTDKPSMVQRAVVPTKKSSPSTVKNTAIGALIGALLVAAVVIVRHLMDDTIKTEDDVQKYLQLNTLASFPYIKQQKNDQPARKGIAKVGASRRPADLPRHSEAARAAAKSSSSRSAGKKTS
ncbi:MAG: polysaccharide export protein [Lachnospiraceae bacterium]|nr:polysaccharide export protein [Lachnospiraceae bacterium]